MREPPSIVLPIYPGSLSLVWIRLYVEVHLCWSKVRFWRAPETSSDESFIFSEQIQVNVSVKFGCHWPDLCPQNLYFYLISLALYSVGGTRLSSPVIYTIIISFLPTSHKWPNVMIRLINLGKQKVSFLGNHYWGLIAVAIFNLPGTVVSICCVEVTRMITPRFVWKECCKSEVLMKMPTAACHPDLISGVSRKASKPIHGPVLWLWQVQQKESFDSAMRGGNKAWLQLSRRVSQR